MFKAANRVSCLVLVGLALLIVIPGILVTAAASQPQIAVYTYGSEVTIFWDPSDSYSDEIIWMHNVYETLLRYDPFTDGFEPILAESYEISEDGLTWTFYLRQGVKFHTGNEMDATAVKASIERTINRDQGPVFVWDAVDSIEAVDKYTVAFHLKYPAPLDISAAAVNPAFIFDPEYADHDWFNGGRDAGTGPYMLESHEGLTKVVVTAFPDYWRGWEGDHFDKVVFQTVTESSTRRLMLEAGQAEIANDLPVTDIQALQGSSAVRIGQTASYQNLLALFNTEKPPLDNKLVRAALAYTIPYQGIIDGVRGGFGEQARGVVPRNLWGYSDRVKQYTLSIPTARTLLEQAGYPDGGFKLLLTYVAGDDDERRVGELWKSELAKLNIELELRGMPWDPQWNLARSPDPNDRQDIYLFYWWPDYSHPHSFLSGMFESEEEINYNLDYYDNPVFDALINAAVALAGTDRDEAINLYAEAQNVLMEDAPGVTLYTVEYLRATTASLVGYVDNPAYPHVVWWYDCYRSE